MPVKQLELDERKKRILEAIVRDYLHTAEPVGSRTIWRSYMPDLSPATIRNEMADLEAMGFIVQPHTSAGRIPTDIGYRFYVDHLMKNRQLTVKEEELINEGLKTVHNDVEDALHQTLKLLSHLLEYASVVATLNNRTRVYSSGFSHMLKQPEFSDINFTRHVMEIVEEEDLMAEMVREYTTEKGVTIRIGSENKFKEVKNCSVVMSSYEMKDTASGGIGVIGPTRMSYARVASILETISRRLDKLTEE
ncbi:MAG: heat-inducible transcriptional repressor HrcA [Candidatus Margulisbacteria bacterium]|nr:heat-inducible transcriptional repressor HrcA [Candidatus Margulisiibacteriota bacterium]